MLSAAVTPSYVLPNREPCWGSDQAKGGATLKTAAVVAGIGVGLTLGGGSWLGVEAHRYGSYAPRKQRWMGFGIGAASFVLSQALLGALFFADSICHS